MEKILELLKNSNKEERQKSFSALTTADKKVKFKINSKLFILFLIF
jgi:hypothetical protein